MQQVMVARPGVSVKIALTVAVALGGIGFVTYASGPEAQHYTMVDELVAEGLDAWHGKALKVHGWVTDGSIVHGVHGVLGQELRHTFVLAKAGKSLRVFAHGPLPDGVRGGAELVIAGRLVAAAPLQPLAIALCATRGCSPRADAEQLWVLDASEIFTRCATRYDGARDRGEPAPVFK